MGSYEESDEVRESDWRVTNRLYLIATQPGPHGIAAAEEGFGRRSNTFFQSALDNSKARIKRLIFESHDGVIPHRTQFGHGRSLLSWRGKAAHSTIDLFVPLFFDLLESPTTRFLKGLYQRTPLLEDLAHSMKDFPCRLTHRSLTKGGSGWVPAKPSPW